jgi:hypothetical protein
VLREGCFGLGWDFYRDGFVAEDLALSCGSTLRPSPRPGADESATSPRAFVCTYCVGSVLVKGAARKSDRYNPVGTDEERAHENGRRTDERSIAGFDPAQRGPAR